MTKTKTTAKPVTTATIKASTASGKKNAVVQSEPTKKDAAPLVLCNPSDPDFIAKIIDAVAVNVVNNAASRKAFAKILKHHSKGKVMILTDKELASTIKKQTKG